MATRKIKDAKDLNTGSLVYIRGHAMATFMSDGRTVEDAINSISTGGGGSGDAPSGDYVTRSELADVATSGSYNDLSDKPTIPGAVTKSTVSGWGFGTYSKPSGGIPKSDLASAVQTSLGKADNAFSGTINGFNSGNMWLATGVKINGTTKTPNSEGVVDLGTIEGGSSGGSVEKEVVLINDGLIEELEPDKIYIVESPTGVFEIQSFAVSGNGYDEYTVFFYAESPSGGGYTPTIILPDEIYWANGVIPDTTEKGCYELSVVHTVGVNNEFFNAVLTPFKAV